MTSFMLFNPPEEEPVTLAEMKAHARIDTDADDALLSALIISARQWAENYTRRAFMIQTWRLWLDEIPMTNFIELPRPPLAAVYKVRVYDDNDSWETWPAGNYFVDEAREPARLVLRYGATWPAPGRNVNGIMVEYDAGYGEEPHDVPEPIKLAIKQLVAHWYENRGEAVIISAQNTVNVPLIIQALLNPYRVQRVGA